MLVSLMRKRVRFLLLLIGSLIPARGDAAIVDRIAATVEGEVITVSEVNQLVTLRFLARERSESDDDYRRRTLEAMIAQALRFRDVERFGAADIPPDSIEARLGELRARFGTDAEFAQALARTELTLDELRALIKRQLQVEAYIEERFSPLIFVSLEEIERYYREVWSVQRRERGLPVVALSQVREEIRSLLKQERLQGEINKWTTQLRARANVDIYVYR